MDKKNKYIFEKNKKTIDIEIIFYIIDLRTLFRGGTIC